MSDQSVLILCSGYCEHGKFMGECWECAEGATMPTSLQPGNELITDGQFIPLPDKETTDE